MTVQETINVIDKETEQAQKNSNEKLIEAYKNVSEILHSRIPMEPVYDENAELMKYRCPSCHAGLTGFEQFCDACGQAILWTEDIGEITLDETSEE